MPYLSLSQFRAAHPALADSAEALVRAGAVRSVGRTIAGTPLFSERLLERAAGVEKLEGHLRTSGTAVACDAGGRRAQYERAAQAIGIPLAGSQSIP